MKLQESGENYLEMIFVLQNKNGRVRSIDIAKAMSYSKPSVSRAMSVLKKAGYIIMHDDGYIELTESGLKVADRVYTRHRLLTKWLTDIGVNPVTAAEDACRMEHVLSPETFQKIREHIESKSLRHSQ
jgi:DtxR family Mn-dependent transcriptional regulator